MKFKMDIYFYQNFTRARLVNFSIKKNSNTISIQLMEILIKLRDHGPKATRLGTLKSKILRGRLVCYDVLLI